jgi:hypothetical protein
MDSYAFQDLPQKRIKKLAIRLTDDEIRASLQEDSENIAFIYEDSGAQSVMYRNAHNGPMAVFDDNSVRAYAQLELLRRRGAPVLRSVEEIEAYATLHNWPRKKRSTNEAGIVY